MKLSIETIKTFVPVTSEMLADVRKGFKLELVDRLAYQAYLTAVEHGKPRRKVGHYKSRYKRGRFASFWSMRVTTEQPMDFFIRNIHAFTMTARATYTSNRRVRWHPRRSTIAIRSIQC